MTNLSEQLRNAINAGKKEFEKERRKSGRTIKDEANDLLSYLNETIEKTKNTATDQFEKASNKAQDYKNKYKDKKESKTNEDSEINIFDLYTKDIEVPKELMKLLFGEDALKEEKEENYSNKCDYPYCDCEDFNECDEYKDCEDCEEYHDIYNLYSFVDHVISEEINEIRQANELQYDFNEIKTKLFYLTLLKNEIELYCEDCSSKKEINDIIKILKIISNDDTFDFQLNVSLIEEFAEEL